MDLSSTVRNPPGPQARPDILQALGLQADAGPKVLLRILVHATRYRARFAAFALASVGATLFGLATPRLLGHAVDQVHALLGAADGRRDVTAGLWLSALMLLCAATVRGLLQMFSGYNAEFIGQSVARDLRLAYFEKLQRLGFDFHDRIHSGDLITRGMLDLEGMRTFIENGVQRSIGLVLLLVLGCAILFSQDVVMAALTLSFIPFVAWRAVSTGAFLRRAWTLLQERLAVVTRVMEENLQGARVVRAFPSYRHEMAKFDAVADDALKISNHRFVIRASSAAVITTGYYLAMALLLWVGARRVEAGLITIGQLTEFLAYMTVLQPPVRQVGMIMNSSARAISSGGRLYAVLDVEPTIRDAPDARPLALERGVLRFEGVDFSYGGGAGPTVQDIAFVVEPGRTLGIVGPSGAGKSTIAQLLARFYDVDAGRITIDGQDIREVTLTSLRKAVAVIQQDTFLFDDSAGRNIAYAEPLAAQDDVEAAAGVAHIHDHLAGLPGGYETSVGERGSGLSGGQRQRLSIARGLVAEASVLVFDDATSAVDAATERGVREALSDATHRQATLIISHRLSSLMHADEIIVLRDGRIVERGDHHALLALRGFYAELYALQTLGGDARPAPQRQDA